MLYEVITFPVEQLAPTRYFGGLPGVSTVDWPVPAAEMAHWYGIAEKNMGVSGTHGWPKLPESNNYRVLAEGARRIGRITSYNVCYTKLLR